MGKCKTCMNSQGRLWYQANREKRIAQTYAYTQSHPSVRRECQTRWRAKNMEYYRRKQMERRHNMPDWYREYERSRRQQPKRMMQDRLKNYRRRQQKRLGSFVFSEWQAKLMQYDGKCYYCHRIADTIDHLMPLSRGGTNNIDNLVPACRGCNSQKCNKTLGEYGDWLNDNFKTKSRSTRILVEAALQH